MAAVWTCELEPAEVGNPLSFDLTLASPDGSNRLIQHWEGWAHHHPSQPVAIPYFWTTNFLNFVVDFQAEGVHRFDIRSGDGTTCSIPLYVQGPLP